MSSPKPLKSLRSRSDRIGTSGRVSIVRKKMRSRVVILPSRCSATDGVVHPELIGAGQCVGLERSLEIRRAGKIEGAHVHVGRDADARRVRHRVGGAALAILEGLNRAQRVERGHRRRIGADRAGIADHDALAGEERLAPRVGRGRPGESLEDQHRMIGRGGVEFGQRRQALLRELRRIPSAHRRDETAGRHALGARLDARPAPRRSTAAPSSGV